MTSPTDKRTWSVQGTDANPERGICSITYKGSTLRFRTNPNLIRWSYKLNTHVDTTYGGRVVQLLSTKIGDLRVTAEAGGGRWDYLQQVAKWFRDLLIDQRGGEPAIFAYSTRGWRLKVFAESIPFQDRKGDTLKSFDMTFKVQEDITGVMSQWSLTQEISRLQEGIGFHRGKYNQPPGYYDQETGWLDPTNVANIVGGIGGVVGEIAGVVTGLVQSAAPGVQQLSGSGNPSATTIYGNPESGSTAQSTGPGSISGLPGFNFNSTSGG